MKIGDKIEILEKPHGGSEEWWNVGDVYTITYVDRNYFTVKKSNDATNGWSTEFVKFKILNQLNYYFY